MESSRFSGGGSFLSISSLRRSEINSGIDPWNLFVKRFRSFSCLRFAKSSGISPVNELMAVRGSTSSLRSLVPVKEPMDLTGDWQEKTALRATSGDATMQSAWIKVHWKLSQEVRHAVEWWSSSSGHLIADRCTSFDSSTGHMVCSHWFWWPIVIETVFTRSPILNEHTWKNILAWKSDLSL